MSRRIRRIPQREKLVWREILLKMLFSFYFKENHKCDVLESEHRLSCARLDQRVHIYILQRHYLLYILKQYLT